MEGNLFLQNVPFVLEKKNQKFYVKRVPAPENNLSGVGREK
jgi:hypothetical protein